MSIYVGGKPRHKSSKTVHIVVVLILVVAAAGAFGYFNYLWPQLKQNDVVKKLTRADELAAASCEPDNKYCQERLSKAVNAARDTAFTQALKASLATDEIRKHLTKAHTDDSVCFLVDADETKPPSTKELTTWLKDYGSKEFQENANLIERMRNAYEAKYLKPSPRMYQIELFRTLRWRHIPFSQTWRDYTLAARYLEWSAIIDGPEVPGTLSSKEKRLMRAIEKHPSYFTDKNIVRLEDLVKRTVTLEKLAAIRDAVRQYRRDVRDLPVSSDRSKLQLGWLISNNDMFPWNKKRWRGPYLSETALVDPWGCPIVGERMSANGAMELVSRGSDCTVGGKDGAEDLSLDLVPHASQSYSKETEKVDKPIAKLKKRRRKKRRQTFNILP